MTRCWIIRCDAGHRGVDQLFISICIFSTYLVRKRSDHEFYSLAACAIATFVSLCLGAIPSLAVPAEPPPIIETVAGNGTIGNEGDGEPATAATLAFPEGVAVGADGSLYVTSNGRVRRVAPDGTISTFAGGGSASNNSGDGGPATAATLFGTDSIAIGPDGSVYISEPYNSRVRRVSPSGIITTVAGTGQYGFAGDGGPATQAQFRDPKGLAVGADGTLYIADENNNRIRRVTLDGIITTFAGDGKGAGDPNAPQCGTGGAGLRCGDGGPATQAQVWLPTGIAMGVDGVLYIADLTGRLRRVGTNGIISTAAVITSATWQGQGIAVSRDGAVYVSTYTSLWGGVVYQVNADGTLTTITGNFTYGDSGDGGPATQAQISTPEGLAVGPDGSIYIADDLSSRVRRVGQPRTLPTSTPTMPTAVLPTPTPTVPTPIPGTRSRLKTNTIESITSDQVRLSVTEAYEIAGDFDYLLDNGAVPGSIADVTFTSVGTGACQRVTNIIQCRGTFQRINIAYRYATRSLTLGGLTALESGGFQGIPRDTTIKVSYPPTLTYVRASEEPQSNDGHVLTWYRAGATTYSVIPVFRSTIAPSVFRNVGIGHPASLFTFALVNVPAGANIPVRVNGRQLNGLVHIGVDGTARFVIRTDALARNGRYIVSVALASQQSLQTQATSAGEMLYTDDFILDNAAPLLPQDMSVTTTPLDLPPDIGPLSSIYLPLTTR